MAIFNSDFKYHKDTVEKHPLTEEELQFLKAFQTERNTQDTVWQASPRYWVIKGSKTVFVDGIDEGEVIKINDENFYDVNTGDLTSLLTDTKEKLEDYLDEGDLYFDGVNELIVVINGEEYVVDDIESAFEALSDILYMDDVEIGSYEKVDIIYPGAIFLTHKECENHLRKYGYNYSEDAHAYAMTAYRSPEVETLLNLLETVDWDSVNLKD